MTIETIQLKELTVFAEFFLGISIMYLIVHGLFVAFNNNNGFPLIQASLINLAVVVIFISCLLLWNNSLNVLKSINFSNTIVNDYLSFFAKIIIGISSIVCLLFIKQYLISQKINSFEYIILILFAILGLFLLTSSNDFITTYLAIELQSLSFYILAAFKKNSSYSVESGLKYFILGAFSSGLFLLGSSFIYAGFGTINFTDLKDFSLIFIDLNKFEIEDIFFMNNMKIQSFAILGLLFIFISLFFKLALAPFHVWSPDIYENSPTSSSFFFAVVPKISIFVVIVRFSYYALFDGLFWWQELVALIAVVSVMVGSLGGLEQRKFKSLLAYSSISHMGYLMITFSAASLEGFQMLFSYLVVYIMFGLCVWSILILTRLKKNDNKKQNKDLADFILLKKSNFMLGIILLTALFSIAGLPPMIGFMVKLNIFLIVVEKTLYFLALFSILFSVISTFFYLRIIKVLYFEPVLIGKLYYPIKNINGVIVVVLFYLFVFLFINPSLLYLISNKVSLLFV
jgi:NADH-quinone oxidoreductase subunit N